MPTLRQLRCVIEWGNTETPFPEYGTTYGDGVVETYIAIPDHPQPFAIHLTSRNYIAEGLSMLVFMDGDYHCNRNRLNLQRPEPGIPRNLTEIGLRVRQKENPLGEGRYLGRGWRFDKHKIGGSSQPLIDVSDADFTVPLNQLPSTVHRQHFNDLGTICVFVLRCRAKEEVDFKSSTSSEVDDSALQTPEPTDPTPSEDHAPSTTAEPQGDGGEPDTLLGFLNDGATDVCHFGLDGEGPGPAEQKAWSWNTQRPSPSARQGPSGGYTPGQPPPAQNQPYGNYGHPPGFARSGQPGPAFSQSQPTTHRPQRHVHFNDQLPPQPSGYGAPSQQASGQDASGNAGQPQEREYPQQANNVGHPPPSQFAHQVPNYAPVHDGYVNPWLPHAGIPNAQDHSRGFPAGTDWSYPAPMPNTQDFSRGFAAGGDWAYPPPVQHTQDHSRTVPAGENVSYLPPMPSYQPVGYGVSSYPGWTLAPITPAYTQPAWPAQPMPAYGVPGFPTPPAFVPPSLPSRAHPNPQPTWQSSPAASTPAPASSHPGGGVWGPPPTNPGSQDPAKDENNQLDGQTYQNQDNTSNIGGQSNDNNNQDLANAANDGTQAGSSGWNNNEASGGQMNDWNNNGEGQTDNWNNTAGETEAPSHDWNQSTANAGQTDNTGSPWNANASTNTQVQDSWDANANASTQVQNSWNAAAATAQPAEATFRFPQQDSPAAMPAQGRSLHGPHGPYYHTLHTSAGQRIQADAGEEPPYDVPADMPTTHQVKPGEGYLYVHKRRSPEYLDTLEEPYARFVFKYRTKGESSRFFESSSFPVPCPRSSEHPACCSSWCMRTCLHNCGTPTVDEYWPNYDDDLDGMFGSEADHTWNTEQIENETGIKIEDKPTGDEEKRKLQEMQKDELVEMLLRAKVYKLLTLSYYHDMC